MEGSLLTWRPDDIVSLVQSIPTEDCPYCSVAPGLPCALHRAAAELAETRGCTGLTAAWCPIHGDCSCPDRELAMDDPRCPLHAPESSHGAKVAA